MSLSLAWNQLQNELWKACSVRLLVFVDRLVRFLHPLARAMQIYKGNNEDKNKAGDDYGGKRGSFSVQARIKMLHGLKDQ